MVRLREVPRTATFAWSPGTALPLLATGTRAGAVDADFSNDPQLEIWHLDLNNAGQGIELQPTASIGTDSRYVCSSLRECSTLENQEADPYHRRFHDIAWVKGSDEFPRGIIAGALENGSLDLWNADKLLGGSRWVIYPFQIRNVS